MGAAQELSATSKYITQFTPFPYPTNRPDTVKPVRAEGLDGLMVTVMDTVALADGRIAQATTTASSVITISFCSNLTLTPQPENMLALRRYLILTARILN